MIRKTLFGTVTAALLFSISSDARACGYHGIIADGFSAQFPGSIEVAIALREAADNKLIGADALSPKKANLLAYHRTVQRLQKLSATIFPADIRSVKSFSLLLVESALWSRYVNDGQGLSVFVHTNGPEIEDAVLLTGEPVIIAIESGQLSWQEAIQRKLLVIVTDKK